MSAEFISICRPCFSILLSIVSVMPLSPSSNLSEIHLGSSFSIFYTYYRLKFIDHFFYIILVNNFLWTWLNFSRYYSTYRIFNLSIPIPFLAAVNTTGMPSSFSSLSLYIVIFFLFASSIRFTHKITLSVSSIT